VDLGLIADITDAVPVAGLGAIGAAIVGLFGLLLRQYATVQTGHKGLADAWQARAEHLEVDLHAAEAELDVCRHATLAAEGRAQTAEVLATAANARVDVLGLEVDELRRQLEEARLRRPEDP
jgi:hypothetical protein